jgi:hypothetical protein
MTNTAVATAKQASDIAVVAISAACLRWRST